MKNLFLLSLTFCLLGIVIPSELSGQPLHHANRDLPCVNKNYNLLVHVAVDSTLRAPLFSIKELDTMIIKLNEYFSPICVSFSICEFNVLEDDYSLGMIDNQPLTVEQRILELETRFSLRRRINIFFLDYIDQTDCGLSTFEGILTTNDANIFIERDCTDEIPEQVAHHLGHTFGLKNTYDRETIELVDGSNCLTTGDLLCDTPADPFQQPISNATIEEQLLIDQGLLVTSFISPSCEFVYEIKDPNGEYYQPDMGNIMSGYPCKCGFTQDQYRLMVETILKSDIRHF